MKRRLFALVVILVQLCSLEGGAARLSFQALETPRSARTWEGRNAEFEKYIRTAPFVRIEDVPIGFPQPKRGFFAPGGLVASVAIRDDAEVFADLLNRTPSLRTRDRALVELIGLGLV